MSKIDLSLNNLDVSIGLMSITLRVYQKYLPLFATIMILLLNYQIEVTWLL
jgi:hypothetical protein